MINIKRLQAADLPLFRQLNSVFAQAFDDPANYTANQPSDNYATHFLQQPQHIVLVALDGDEVVGGLVAYTLTKFEQQRSEIFIYDMAIAPDKQRQGIGTKLIEQLRAIARDSGTYVIFVQADEGDAAIHFYESLHPTENLRTRNFDIAP